MGGTTYNCRSAQLTAGALANGSKTISIVATDIAANVTNLSGSVTVDNVVPAPNGLSASGGIAGRPEVGDVLTLSTNDTLDTFSILSTWTGSATTVQLRFVQQGGGDRIQIWNAAGTAQLPFGTINTNRNDFTTGTLSFNGSTMTQANGVITIVLGAPVVGAVTTVGAGANMQWTPVNTVTDRAGNAITTGAYKEPRRRTTTSTSSGNYAVGTAPPSTAHAAPVTFDARSEHRKVITAATSSSVPIRPSGGLARVAASTSSRVEPVRAAIWSARPPSDFQSLPLHHARGHGVHEYAREPRTRPRTPC